MLLNEFLKAHSKLEEQDRKSHEQGAAIAELNRWLSRYAEEHGHVYLDYVPAMSDERGMLKADLSEDGLHPNAKGYAVMTPLAEKAVAAALRRKP